MYKNRRRVSYCTRFKTTFWKCVTSSFLILSTGICLFISSVYMFQYDLGCSEWLRALAGTLSSVGSLMSMMLIGYFSDRFGRRLALMVAIFNVALFGLIRAFSVNYPMYLVLQILNTTFGGGTFTSAYIFGKIFHCSEQLFSPTYRTFFFPAKEWKYEC